MNATDARCKHEEREERCVTVYGHFAYTLNIAFFEQYLFFNYARDVLFSRLQVSNTVADLTGIFLF
jgi:hypothetical protein